MRYGIRWAVILIWLAGGSMLAAGHPGLRPEPRGEEAQYSAERADSLTGFDVTKYEIYLSVNDQTHFISGRVKAYVTAEAALSGISYNLEGLSVTQVKFNDTVTTYTHQNGIVQIDLSAAAGQQFTTEVSYSGVTSHSPAPYNLGIIYGNNTCFTLSDPDASRYWWPCYDHPWDKAIVDLHITMRSDWLVACNGLRESIVDNGDGTKTHNWLGFNPMSPYLACFTAGPYVEINQSAGAIPIQNFVQQSQYNNALFDFAPLPEMLQFLETQFGPYPFEKYGNAVVNMTTYGAMEHQTMTTLGYQFIPGNQAGELTIAHELAHSWYGNCLTPLTFKDVWLSEGFATYSEALWIHHRYGWQNACEYINSSFHQYYISFENANSTLPNIIYDPPFNHYFYPQSYEKAASVLHMLRLKIGNAAFFQLLQTWFSTYYNGNVVTAEFQAMAEQISGQDLDQFFQQWIYSRGIPEIDLYVFRGYNMIPEMRGLRVVGKTSCSTGTEFTCEVPLRIRVNSSVYDSLNITASTQGQATTQYFYTIMEIGEEDIQTDPNHWVLNRGYNLRKPVLTQALAADGAVHLTWEAYNCPQPVTGYRIQRKVEGSPSWADLYPDMTVTGLTYTDTTAVNGTHYQYRIMAVDPDGFYSLPSNELSATPLAFPFDWGMLVVDETRDGTGSLLSPTDGMVDEFYSAALSPIPYTNWDHTALGAPTLSTLSHYPLVLWHADDFSQILFSSSLETISSYIMSGGKLILSGWKTPSVFSDTFINNFLPQTELVYDNGAVLISAQSATYPQLLPDPDKLTPTWNGMLPMVYTFDQATDILYSAQTTPEAAGAGLPVAVRYHNNGDLVLFGIPLYYMQHSGVRGMLQQLVPQLLPGVPNQDQYAPAVEMLLSCHPNPFQDRVTLQLSKQPASAGEFAVYNTKGQLVWIKKLKADKTKLPIFVWDGTDRQNKALPGGIYLVRYRDRETTASGKLILLR
jgi:hypothetical protein